jgi:hypothetical protein
MKRTLAVRVLQPSAALTIVAALAVSTACGGSSAKSIAATTPSTAAGASSNAPQRGPGNRTPSAEQQTSIAEGTPRGFGNRTPPPEIQTSIAEGTPPPAFGNRTPSASEQTAIAQGTPANSFRGPGGGGGGRGVLTALATVLGIDRGQLATDLQAPGATVASVAAAHGKDRATVRQALIDATKLRLADAVAAGTIPQSNADQNETQFESTIDAVLDSNGGGGPPQPAGQ